MRSRIKQNVKKQNLKTLFIIGAIIAFFLIFGSQILIGFSIAIDKIRGSEETASQISGGVDYLAPPFLAPLPDATMSNRVDITGSTANPDVTVELFINDKKINEEKPDADNNFTFEQIELNEGENRIKTKAVSRNSESEFSQIITIKYLNKEPTLELSMPQDGQTYKKDQSPIKISGKTDPGAKVTVNDFWAITNNEGEFYYTYSLKDGGNNLKIKSTDEAGNEKLIEININAE